MTDNEIKKALECCVNGEDCPNCPLQEQFADCEPLTGALDLINRQKAEIERLQGCVKSEDEVREIMKSQMFPMIKEVTKEQIDKAFALGKVEGVIEFAERLKEKMRLEDDCNYNCTTCFYECKDYIPEIDNLVKEMVGAE